MKNKTKKKLLLPLLAMLLCFTIFRAPMLLQEHYKTNSSQIMPLSDREDLFDDTRDH